MEYGADAGDGSTDSGAEAPGKRVSKNGPNPRRIIPARMCSGEDPAPVVTSSSHSTGMSFGHAT
jgi:hypothetical protein